ncbi:MAG: hypothetical protein NTW64_04245 [Candidatus Omnitrophica bacterium]|nr:hypothetical protein [Candidatus Omnitrophota bacterium]
MFCNCFLKLGKRAQALIVAYMIITVFVIIFSGLLSKAITEKNLSLRNKLETEAFYMAEGGIEDAISYFASSIADYQVLPDIETMPVVTTFTTFGGATVNSIVTRIDDSDRIILEGGTNVLVRNYEVISSATHPRNNSIIVTLHQIIARRLIPTFQHAVFYNDDLEILPGANMTLSGRVHCNKDMYLDAENEKTLKIDSFSLHSGGNIYNQRKDTGLPLAGEVSIRVNKSGSAKYEDMDNLDSDAPEWTTESIDLWKGTVKNSVHGITKLTAPSVASIQDDGYYADNAQVVIVNNTVTKGGVTLIEGTDYPAGAVTETTTLYNNREGQYIKTTNIDLKKLSGVGYTKPNGQPYDNNLPENGLLYATRDDAGSFYEPGIRLINGSEIHRARGLAVVSNEPVYILGDYNTINEKPASVICDSVNLLSNSWSDAKSTQILDARVATVTTVNSAFISGIDNTTSGHYNGGLENYPRLHEKWSSVQLNIKGSFVELWNSSIATGLWGYGSPQYTAPTRNWNYNTNFNDTSKLPPFTPWAVEIQRIAWWKE